MEKIYGKKFYETRLGDSEYSARVISSIVKELVNPASVVDVGCGVGVWLKAFRELGIDSVLGIEGEWVQDAQIVVPKECLFKTDLSKEIDLNRKFDLAVSLEVAEHIDKAFADQFLDNLVKLAPVILFSAAIPLQGGSNHVNEQWPDYWRQKFLERGYVVVDCIRQRVWDDPNILMWYAQNSFMYVKKEALGNYPRLMNEYVERPSLFSIVHPRFYAYKIKRLPIMKAVKYRIQRFFG